MPSPESGLTADILHATLRYSLNLNLTSWKSERDDGLKHKNMLGFMMNAILWDGALNKPLEG